MQARLREKFSQQTKSGNFFTPNVEKIIILVAFAVPLGTFIVS